MTLHCHLLADSHISILYGEDTMFFFKFFFKMLENTFWYSCLFQYIVL